MTSEWADQWTLETSELWADQWTLETNSDYKKLYLLKGLNYHFSSKKKKFGRGKEENWDNALRKEAYLDVFWKWKSLWPHGLYSPV